MSNKYVRKGTRKPTLTNQPKKRAHGKPGAKMARRARKGTLTQRNYGGVIGYYFQELTKRYNWQKIKERKVATTAKS